MRNEAEHVQPILLRVEEVAQLLGIGRSTVYTLIGAGELPVVRIGRVTRVSRHALDGWIDARTQRWAS